MAGEIEDSVKLVEFGLRNRNVVSRKYRDMKDALAACGVLVVACDFAEIVLGCQAADSESEIQRG